MPKVKFPAASLAGSVSDIEAAFYEALLMADIDKLMACWAQEEEVICVHPGGTRLIGLDAIRAAFESLFANGSVRATPQRVHALETLGSAVHSVVERIEILTPEGPHHAYVIATNVFYKTPQGWRLVAHHASPGTLSDMQEDHAAPQVLH